MKISLLGGVILGLTAATDVAAQDDCPRRSALDAIYCDSDGDLVADPPADPALWRNPETLVWAYTPIEDPAVYATLFKPFTRHLSDCVGKQVVYYPVQSNAAEVEAMRSGRLHFAGFSTGPTVSAVTHGGAVPFAAKGVGDEVRGYSLVAIVIRESRYQNLGDLKGRRVAHASPMSNSGNLAPRALFPDEGLEPGVDYDPIMSGGHDRSVLGVLSGEYDMAAVASDVLERMAERGMLNASDLRVIYTSPLFPTSSFAHAHDLHPELVATLKDCFFSFTFPIEMVDAFQGDERFLPITYRDDWAIVRDVIGDAESDAE
ncbi:MAG: phosphate/phosphite/phosphonate ABC transporter substrate-binding protein [Pseudorhodobacter sp.]